MIIDGRTISNHILAELLIRVDELQEKYNIQPHLAVIRVGDDDATTSYITQKEKTAKRIGAVVSVYNFPESIKQEELQESIDFLQQKSGIHGIILQLPVPSHIDYEKLIADIHPDKDVDGFVPHSQFVIPIAKAVLKVLEIPMIKEIQESGETLSFNEWLLTKKFVVVGKGKTGGQPIIDILKEKGGDVTVVDTKTPNPTEVIQTGDVVISAVGKPGLITKDMIKKDAILISVGISLTPDGNFVGDYDENDIKDKASWYTPTPGGIGPVNVATLMENLVIAAENSTKN